MNTETLQTFVMLSEVKNYTLTANRLFIAQSTVTNRTQELEQEVGKPLLLRSRKQLSLTPEGEHFLAYAKRILALEHSAVEELNHMGQYNHSLRIGTTNTIYDCQLASFLLSYQRSSKNCKLDITISHSFPLIRMLQDGTLDLAFTYIPFHKNSIQCDVFNREPLLLVTSSSNTAYKKGITQDELAMIPYYYCDFNFRELGSFIKELFPAGHSFPLVMDRSANLLPFLLSGNGYSFLPESLVKDYLEDGQLLQIPLLDFLVPPIESYLLYKKPAKSDILKQDFIQTVINP